MSAKYPFIPKTNVKMRFGDYWPVQRDDGDFGFCVFLEPWAHLRKGIVIALLDLVSDSPIVDEHGPILRLVEAGNTNVETFPATSTSVVGNIASRIDRARVDELLAQLAVESHVWGIKVPPMRANLLTARRQA